MATNRKTIIPIGIMPITKWNFVMVFMETIRISHTPTVLHIIDNIELKLDCKFKNRNICQDKSQLDIFPKIAQPYYVHTRDASIRYYGSVSAPIRSFSADRVSVRRDRYKSDVVRILFCAVVKPHENHINIIKHHKVFVHYISSVLKLFHNLIRGIDEHLNR